MTVEEIRGSSVGEPERFPVGMRVLAVDDNPTCLMLLDGLLRKCQYQVTTTSQAKTALKMLREDRSRFDLVISDVEMPDMDGFKLLELVGLEMDLPVIMLSSYSDPKLVMKGIKHGACDYLVKPIRIEELRNIWQHLVRRKKLVSKSSTLDKDHQEHGEGGNGPAPTENADQNRNLNRKRKDEEEEEEEEENGEENEDSAIQKKPRVVWSIELHGKFVAAVNQLGIEKAVPKRVLDMMNVEGITRENVASHLQKYRLYLKRISSMETQRANMVAALGGTNSSSMRTNSFDGLRDFRTLSGNGRLSNPALSSYQTGGILSRLNSPAGVSLHCLSSSALIQPRHAQNLSNSIANLGKPQSVLSPANQNAGFFQGIPTPLELDQLDQSKCTARIPVLNTAGDPITFADDIVPLSSSSNSLTSASRYCSFPQGNLQRTQRGGVFGIQSSSRVTYLNSVSFNTGISGSSLLDDHRCNENWQNAFQLSKFSPNPLSESFNPGWMPPNSMTNDNYSPGLPIHSSPLDFCSTDTISAPVEDSSGEIQCRMGFIGDYTENSNHVFSTLNSMVPSNGVMGSLSQVLDPNNGVYNRKIDASLVSQSNSSASTLLRFSEVEKSAMDSQMWSSRDYHLEQTKSQEGFVHNGCDSLDDLMNGLTKQGQDGTVLMDGEFGFDAYSFGSC